MVTQEKIKELKKLLRKGVPAGELITDLQEEGYSDEEIQKIFEDVPQQKGTGTSSEWPLWYLISIGLIILGVTVLLGPPLWLRNYGYFFLTIGLIGMIVRLAVKRGG